ncbi:uncharacterized protein J3D65DRAFT_72263 [Phyllosticta citribraziliensis]|uniref:Zn(2)-C6 fungal-type domain-containing protein n=1 Tax=Phyllosticta citribraziliensis TaxID=989973 RepID=A0ABR1LD54_9PEZI
MPRLGHKKSRNGCVQCKRRRVKCDEQRPCSHCARHGVECSLTQDGVPPPPPPPQRASYSAASQASGDSPQAASTQHSGSSPHDEGSDLAQAFSTRSSISPHAVKSPNNADLAVRLAASSEDNMGHFLPADQNPFGMLSKTIRERDVMSCFTQQLPVQDWHRDLQLLHHYSTNTSVALTEVESIRHCYQVVYPSIGYYSKAVMHGILGVAALHLAHLQPGPRNKWLLISTNHQNRAISQFRLQLPSITPDNCDELYALSSLTTMFRCASLPIPTDPHQPDAIDDTLECFMLTRGVNEVLKTSYVWVGNGPLLPMLIPDRLAPHIPFGSAVQTPLDEYGLQPQFDELRGLVTHEAFDPPLRATLLVALADLSLCYHRILAQPADREPGIVVMFPIRVSPEYMFMVRQRHPAALVLLAYWCCLVHNHSNYWWWGDRGRRVVLAVHDSLEERWRSYLEWPMRYVADDGNVGKPKIIQ